MRSIGRLQLPDAARIIVIVVDNDEQQSARAAFDQAAARLPMEAYYYVKPEPGLSAVRNALLEKALEHKATHIAFIDDDDLARPQWLRRMLEALQHYGADIVTGPVIYIKESDIKDDLAPSVPPPRSYVALRPAPKTGDAPEVNHAFGYAHIVTTNVLFSIRLVADEKLRFDQRFDFIGGGDADFFICALRKGARAVWLAEALVFEVVTSTRATRCHKLLAFFGYGIANILIRRKHHGVASAWRYSLLEGFICCCRAPVALALALLTLDRKRLNAVVIRGLQAAGCLCGLLGVRIERYRYGR